MRSSQTDYLFCIQMFYLIIVAQIVLTLLYVAYLIYQYSMVQVSLVVKVMVYLSWLLSFSIVIILPYDIHSSLSNDFGMGVFWRAIYYTIFVLTWLLLPVAQEYQTAGEFTFKDKLKRAIVSNLIIYGIFAVLAVAFLVYLIIKDEVTFQELTPVLMAASNAFGMFLVVIFLSHGLVALPRQLWRQKKYEIKLKQRQFSAVGLASKKDKVMHQLQLKVKEVYWHIKQHGESPETTFVLNLIPQNLRDKWRKNIPNLGQTQIVKLHRQIKEMMLEVSRLERRWQQLSQHAFMIEDILKNMSNPNKRIQSTLVSESKYDCLNYLQWLWLCRIKVCINPLLAILLSIFAGAVIVGELSVFLPFLAFLNPFKHILQIESFIGLDCALMFILAYIVFCVYYSLFKLKFANFYGLYWNKQTDAASLIFFSINCSRVSTPLCINFLQIVNSSQTAFSKVMGDANIVPVFGQTFNFVFPILLLILIVVNIFDVYTMIARIFNLQKFQFERDFNHENIDEGKRLLQKARIEAQNYILNSNNKDLRQFRSYNKTQTGRSTQSPTKKENSSSEQIALKGKYFNQFSNMEQANKIMSL